MEAFLGVEESLTGRRWVGPAPEEDRLAEAMAQATGLPGPVARLLVQRGVPPEEAATFLSPSLRELLPDPRKLRDMETAAARVNAAVEQAEKVAIFADYDVDGGASAALLIRWLRSLGREATLYVPDRIGEGYGPNAPAISELGRSHSLIICVDCGTLSHEALAAAGRADVLVLDHHLGGETLPPAVAVVNPNRQDESGELGHLCAAAVVFLCLVEANRQRREAGASPLPDLMGLLDLVALATVADVAPLVGVNRALVRQGLKIMAHRAHSGLTALADVAGVDRAPTPYHLGYLLGPRINAGGRVGRADLGARLLATDDPAEASELAERLDLLNKERRDIEASVQQAALEQAEARGLDAPLVWAAGEGWHPGVVGIVASRLKEATGRPSVVIGMEGDEGKGSGRSVSGVDLGGCVHRLEAEGLITRGGGHKMAAGLSLTASQLEPAMARLSELLARQGAGADGPRDLRLDGLILPTAATAELIEAIEQAGPFGASAPAPRFALPEAALADARVVGENHLKISVRTATGQRLDAIGFRLADSPLGQAMLEARGGTWHLAGRLEVNHWQGRSRPQLRLEDAARA
ncbi:single-stranded-DNA-specific exonuclease RecJ [Vannielia litorea]|uniref:single-stranded-DNA-specific exonuclease RecJ n=1 Tax=Vannielia litorea TaxID=1217970 RepID=UPI001BD11613|nr:single-stranded-DNA-specific exonuclease RecJ [Vannielia litorea]MBS8225417.1 single-stranded-DNA-specific exonuclease RecJ [Vannielia litorea]